MLYDMTWLSLNLSQMAVLELNAWIGENVQHIQYSKSEIDSNTGQLLHNSWQFMKLS